MAIIYRNADSVEFHKTSVALGTFDGVHIAHVRIINKAVEYGNKHNIPSGVMLFDAIPANSFSDTHTLRLIKPSDRNAILSELDFIYVQDFDKKFSEQPPEQFVIYLKNVLKAEFVSVGYNYRFGKFAAGDAQLLKTLCEKEGIEVFISEREIYLGRSISSTRIRELIASGHVQQASVLLGRNFFLTGKVVRGLRNGHILGSPTANLEIDESVLIPKSGVYAGFCTFADKKYKCVINVGNNPTFNAEEITVESHLIDFDDELYGKEIKIEFVVFLRDEIKFNSVTELSQQISIDIINTKNVLVDYE